MLIILNGFYFYLLMLDVVVVAVVDAAAVETGLRWRRRLVQSQRYCRSRGHCDQRLVVMMLVHHIVRIVSAAKECCRLLQWHLLVLHCEPCRCSR